jgi:subtilisin-like proprotein convertase family protein
MRRTGLPIGISVLLLLATPALASSSTTPDGHWLALEASTPGEPARVDGVASASTEVRLDIVVPGLTSRVESTRKGARGRLVIPDAGVTGEPGHPSLPALRYMVEVPPGARVLIDLAPESVRRVSLSDLGIARPLLPVQPPVPKIEGAAARAPFVEDAEAYAADRYLPEESAVLVERSVLRGRHVALIEVRPVRYNAVSGSIEVWSRAELRVAFEDGAPAAARREKARLASPPLDAWIEREIVARPEGITPHPAVPMAATSASEGAVGMLVVAHDGFADALQPFLDWKVKSGFKIELLRTSDIAPNPTDSQVKAEIQQRYDTWSDPPLEFLLLVGDTDFCPIHLGNGGGNSQVTDNWYASLDGPDFLPDIAVARISTRTAGETADVVDKLLTYERALFLSDAWIKTAGFIGTNDSGHWGLIEGTHNWCIDTYYTPNGYLPTPWSHGAASCDRHYRSYNATTAEIASSIDAGRSIVNYSGHGGYYSWEGPTSYGSYEQSDVMANVNDGMYPFVISNACITGTLDRTECFGETWLKAPHKGAIGFWGASNNSYWDEDDVLQRDLHDNIFPMDDTPPLGVILNETKLDLYDHYGNTGTVAYYFDMYNLLSEPSLSLWTREPRDWNVSYPASHPIGESSFTVTVNDGHAVQGALVAVRKQDDGVFEAGYTDASGQATLLLDPAPASVGPLEVTVTGHDYRPHEASAEVISPDSPWIVHRSHVVDDSVGGDGDGNANPGEEFVLSVTVENVGLQPATDLQATLTTSTPLWCEILDGQADFPDLAPGVQGTSLPDHYAVRVLDVAPDGASLGFELAWTAAGGHAGVTSFSRQVQAVDFGLDSFAIDDTDGGNGNGVPGPGETVDMTVLLDNVGHRNATGISAVLFSDSPHVTVLQDTADFPDIPAQGQGGSLPPPFSFSVSPSAPDQQPVTFSLTVTEAGSGYEEVFLFDVVISSCATMFSPDVPQPINDNSTVESVLDYPLPISIEEVNVFVDISHTYQGDLKVILVSPSDTSVILHNRTGGSADDIVTWYDTETMPAQSLTAFDGENAYGTWRLIVEDHAGGDTGALQQWALEICGEQIGSSPILTVAGHQMDDSDACNPDGVGDVGETVTLNVTVRNEGWGGATATRASLATSANVAVLNNPVFLQNLAAGEEQVAPFEVLIGAVDCIEQAEFTVNLLALEGFWSESFVESLEADLAHNLTVESLERQGAEPPGWTHSAATGTDDWQVIGNRNHTPNGTWSWFSSDVPSIKDDRLVSPPFNLGHGSPELQFYQWVDLQSGYDGGVLEISTDGGQSWADLGPAITVGPYDRSLGGTNPIAGRDAWTGSYAEWRQVVVDLTPWAGETAQFRWRLTCDAATARTGWWIDDILLHTYHEICDRAPCGVPGEVQLRSVTKSDEDVLVEWFGDPVCIEFTVWRSSDPSAQEVFQDVTAEDPDPTDTLFLDTSGGDLLYWIIVGRGPDGDGPWGHFEP